ncbi:hypothetical protein HZA73_11290 [candidate division TA06 bacterium]|nr:hypothetical protein [candidate division TA06 bacterium]
MIQKISPDNMPLLFRKYSVSITITICLFLLVGIVNQGVKPKIYYCESLIILPETGNSQLRSDAVGVVAGIINATETQRLVEYYWAELKTPKGNYYNSLQQRRIKGVWVENIVGSNNCFKLVVKTADDPQLAVQVSNNTIEYLRKNPYVKSCYDGEQKTLDLAIEEVDQSVKRAQDIRDEFIKLARSRGMLGFNPVDLEVKIFELNTKRNKLLNDQARMHSYEFIQPPVAAVDKNLILVAAKLFAWLMIGSVVGLFAGILYEEKIRKSIKASRLG